MGQYFVFLNLDKKELLDPGCFGGGLRLGDLARSEMLMMAVSFLLAQSGSVGGVELRSSSRMFGRWSGGRVSLIGDCYSGELAGFRWDEETWASVRQGRDGWVDISEHVLAEAQDFFCIPEGQRLKVEEPRSKLMPDGRLVSLTPED